MLGTTMNKPWILLLSALFISSTFTLHSDDLDDTYIGFQVGYRNDNFHVVTKPHRDRSISEPLLKKHSWPNVSSYNFGLNAYTYTEYNIFFKGKLSYGQVIRSRSEFETPEVFRDNFRGKSKPKGTTYEGEIAIGFPIWLNCCDTLRIIPLVGYNYNRFNYNGRGSFLPDFEGASDIPTKAYTHVTVQSPWVGFDVDFPFYNCWRFYGGYEYRWGHLRANTHIKEASLIHYQAIDGAKGHANYGYAALGYLLAPEWETTLTFHYTDWRSYGGNQHLTIKVKNASTKTHEKLLRADWDSWGIIWNFILGF